VETEPFSDTFGAKAQRKKPRLDVGTFEELSKFADEQIEETPKARATEIANPEDAPSIPLPADLEPPTHPAADLALEPIYGKGTSRRIYGELYKVLDSSDVVIHVLDARDPIGTRCDSVISYLKKEKSHKQMIFVLNKCDLVPTWVTVSTSRQISVSFPPVLSRIPMSQVKPLCKFLRTRDCYGRGTLFRLD
jgi:nuclear GTP-binding protein